MGWKEKGRGLRVRETLAFNAEGNGIQVVVWLQTRHHKGAAERGVPSRSSARFWHHALLLVPGFSPAVSSSQKCISRGELQVSLSYQPVAQRMTVNEVVGRLILGAHSVTASGAEHWREVCESPRKPVTKWHSLSEY
ncbi:hypothetical protein MC885_015809 [Smutsia gigantea]|nr:hypothetical protein MC885_015809 [Smutsia gigantea]